MGRAVPAQTCWRSCRANGRVCYYVIGPDGKVLLAYSGFSADRERQIEVLIEKHLPRPPG
jgi:hypothetical protein